MGWADNHIKNLQEGKTVQFRPSGNSMSVMTAIRDAKAVLARVKK